MTTEPLPYHTPTALDYHTAESLHSFLDLSGLILQPYSFLHWKRVTHRPTTSLRGQPHQGLGVPELTNGVLTYWRRLSDQSLILVSAFNVQPAPRLPLSFLNRITKKSTSPRTPRHTSRKPLLLADFV